MEGSSQKGMGIYIHIPFCLSRCDYCDFPSNAGLGTAQQGQYLSHLMKEWQHYANLGRQLGWTYETLYLGGGTPTSLSLEHLSLLFEGLRDHLDFSQLVEVTIEANPATIDRPKLALLKEAGCTRLSFGVQSFDPVHLSWLGRAHDVQSVFEGWDMARQGGWNNLSLDLMYGLEDQDLAHWHRTLDQALALAPEHLSLYQLNIEPHTRMAERVARSQARPVGEEMARAQYLAAKDRLEGAGYRQYEISNYALPGRESQHNRLYWQNREYIGLGAGACGYLQGIRYNNICELEAYARSLRRNRVPRQEEEVITPEIAASEGLFLGLRLKEGIDLVDYRDRYGVDLQQRHGQKIERYIKLGLMELKAGCLALTTEGFLQSNTLLLDLI